MCGVLLAAALCSMEHLYCKYVKKNVHKRDKAGCCALVSLVRISRDQKKYLKILFVRALESHWRSEELSLRQVSLWKTTSVLILSVTVSCQRWAETQWLWKCTHSVQQVRQELDAARLRLTKLQTELIGRGLQPENSNDSLQQNIIRYCKL